MAKTKHLETKYSVARYALIKECRGDELRFYLYVKLYAINKHSAFPSFKSFKSDLDWNKYTVIRVVKMMEAKKRLKVEREKGKNNVYDITWYDKLNEKGSSQETLTTTGRETLPTSRRETLTRTNRNITTNNKTSEILTPSKEVKLFLRDKKYFQETAVNFISEKSNLPAEIVLQELKKFRSYWSELNGTGTKQRWQLEKTFELKRRLGTWFKNTEKFSKVDNNGSIEYPSDKEILKRSQQ